MDKTKIFLVVVGVPSIKNYVFGTDRLIEIRGASALLDYLNREKTETFIKEHLANSEIKRVFANGGSAQFIVTAKEKDLNRCMELLRGYFHNETKGGLRLVWGKAEFIDNNYKAALDKAFLESERAEQELPIGTTAMIHTGYLRECDSCSGIASKPQQYQDDQRILCDTCFRKATYGKDTKSILWQEFSEFLKQKGKTTRRPTSFEEIGKPDSAPRGYTALVYADGNGMGKIIRAIRSWQQFQFFSETVDSAIRRACHEALYEVFWNGSKLPPEPLPAEILLAGGDDMLVYLAADRAFPFAIKVAEKFQAQTQQAFVSNEDSFFKKLLNDEGVTISLGIAIGKSHTPFSILLSQVEYLLNSAKRSGSALEAKGFVVPTYIDYHFTSYYNQISVKDSRNTHLQLKGAKKIRLYHKPYSLDGARVLCKDAKKLATSEIPRTRLKRLGYAPALGKMNGTLECLKLYMRTSEKKRPIIREVLSDFGCFTNMPWNEGHPEYDWTMLVDLMELAELFDANASI